MAPGLILADCVHRLRGHVAMLSSPFAILFEQNGANEAQGRGRVGNGTDDLDAAFDLLAPPFDGICRTPFRSVGSGEGEDVAPGFVHEGHQRWQACA